MGITLDGSTPAEVNLPWSSTSATQATASFSPPSGSLAVIVVNIGYKVTTATGPGVTVADSLANTYTAGPADYDLNFDGTYIFTHRYASAPGAVTVTATRTGQLGAAIFEVVPYILAGTAASQAGAASAHTHSTTGVTAVTASITTTTTGSWTVTAASMSNNEASFTPAGGLTTDVSVDDTTDGNSVATGHVVTGTPGAATLGWTVPSIAKFSWAALEILPASGIATAAAAGASAVTAAAVQKAPATPAGAAAVTAAGTVGTPLITFPGAGSNALGAKIELLLGGVWTDVTQYVMLQNPIQISGMGRADWTSALQAAQLTLTLRNDGRFSPKLAAGAYFPNITRNTRIRVSVNATSVTAVSYSGYRFWGEVSEWPVRWDTSGRAVRVDITASGIWRRMSQLATTLGSAYTRYNSITLTGASAPRCCWPMEDGTGSGQLVAFDSVAGTANAVQSFVTGQAGLSLAACTDFKGSDAIPQLNAATITATVPAGGTATNNVTRFLLSVPAAGDSASGTTNWNLAEIASAGTVAKFEVYLNFAGTLLMQLRNSGGTVIASGTTTTNVKGHPYLVSCELTPSGGNVAFALRLIAPGAAGITESMTGTVTTASVGAVSTVKFGRAGVLMDTAVGGLTVTYGAVPSMVAAAYALGGYAGELALNRFTRICGEMSITAETIGTAATSAAMGPQIDGTLTDVLQSVEDTDCGLLFESRTQFGIGYRTLTSLANQAAAAVLPYTAGVLDPSLAPAFDDSLTRNNVTVTNQSTGYTQQAILTAGAMSVLNPPSGIGNGYAYTRTVNAAADSQIAGIANWLLNAGSVDEVRCPVITVRLAKPAAAGLIAALPGLRPGDYLQITSPPAFLAASAIKQLAWGYTETLGVNTWDLAFNAVPESPYETGFSPGTVQTAQLPGSGAVTSTAPGAGGLGGIIADGSITPAMLNQGITVKTLGGTRITIAAGAPANPDTGDIWIASATGLISQWGGAAWQPFKFDASVTVLPGTVVAANIAASTITAGLLAAGIVVAGIVDATDVFATTYNATNAAGEFLAYDVASPAAGHLVNSIAGAAGADRFSNPYPEGLYSQQLTLANQTLAPPSFTGASVFYSSVAGRPRYLNSAGDDSVLQRSANNVAQFTVGATATFTNISAPLAYQAGEGNQSSEYEIEIDGTGTEGTTARNLDFRLYIDGVQQSGGFTIDNTVIVASAAFRYTIAFRADILLSGAGGTIHIHSAGAVAYNDAVAGAVKTTTNAAVGGDADGVAFDTTASHTLQIRAAWGNATSAGSLTTYRTKIARRM